MNDTSKAILRDFLRRHRGIDMTDGEIAGHLGGEWTEAAVAALAEELGVKCPGRNQYGVQPSAVHTPGKCLIARNVPKANKYRAE